MTRAEALRALIERVQAGKGSPAAATTVLALDRKDATHLFWEVVNNDSLNAVARLEAPLRQRGWIGPFVAPDLYDPTTDLYDPTTICAEWAESLMTEDEARALAPTEARARLLAVLRALLHDAEHGEDGL